MDLPSRLATCQEKKFFERSKHLGRSFASQRLRDCEVLGQRYPNATALYKFLEWDEQVVLEGTLCNSRHVCKDGKCGFYRSMMTGISDIFPEAKQKVVAEAPSSSSSSGSSISSSGSSANKELSADDSKKSHAEHKVIAIPLALTNRLTKTINLHGAACASPMRRSVLFAPL